MEKLSKNFENQNEELKKAKLRLIQSRDASQNARMRENESSQVYKLVEENFHFIKDNIICLKG